MVLDTPQFSFLSREPSQSWRRRRGGRHSGGDSDGEASEGDVGASSPSAARPVTPADRWQPPVAAKKTSGKEYDGLYDELVGKQASSRRVGGPRESISRLRSLPESCSSSPLFSWPVPISFRRTRATRTRARWPDQGHGPERAAGEGQVAGVAGEA